MDNLDEMQDHTRLSERHDAAEDHTRLSDRHDEVQDHTRLSDRHDEVQDHTRLSSRLDDHTVLSDRSGQGNSNYDRTRLVAPAGQAGSPVTTLVGESATLSYDGRSDQIVAQLYEPRSFVDDPDMYSSAQPSRDGSYPAGPSMREGDLRRRTAAVRGRRYSNATRFLMMGFTGAMGVATVAAVAGIVALVAGF